jgi:hypothetical protein
VGGARPVARPAAQGACEEHAAAKVEADCSPALFVDGQPAPGGISDLDAVTPPEIEGIEVYARAATAPAQYKRLDSDCAIILVWTRRQDSPRATAPAPAP